MFTRVLGRSGIEVSALGLGCWAIGGPYWQDQQPMGWGQINVLASMRAIHHALDRGITFFDTADSYGCGQSERVLGRALRGRRPAVVVATKFGHTFDERTRRITGRDATPAYIRRACAASLARLDSDYIDLYQFHLGDYDPTQADIVRDVLEDLVAEGKIRWYAWSTNDPARARVFAPGAHCVAVQHRLNLADDNAAMLALCVEYNLASVDRSPLMMGLLSGKYTVDTRFPRDDVRQSFDLEARAELLRRMDAIRAILTADSRTLVQGALGWIWARSARTIPIPGFRSVAQVDENVAALDVGPLTPVQMREIDALLSRPAPAGVSGPPLEAATSLTCRNQLS